MKKIIVFSFLLISLITHGQNDQRIKDSLALYAPTEIGKPDGEPVSQKIGKDGGTLISSDNKITLIIPAGALLSETLISIQPTTNFAQESMGKAYQLEPSGIQFQKPAQLVFHYTDEEMDGQSPELMGVAWQDDNGAWKGLRKVNLDKISKTITANIKHFSGWCLAWAIFLKPEKTRLKVSEFMVVWLIQRMLMDSPGEEPSEQILDGAFYKNINWSVNGIPDGDNNVGKIVFISSPPPDGGMFQAISRFYDAPAQVPDNNPVEIKVEIIDIMYENKVYPNTTRKCKVRIYDNLYEVKMVYTMDAPAGSMLGVVKYKDYGSFIISLNKKEAEIIEMVNKNAEWTYIGKCTVVPLKAGSGTINIIAVQSIKLIPAASPKDHPWIEIFFVRSPTIFPLLQFTCPNVNKGGTFTTTSAGANAIGSMIPAFPTSIKFEAKEGEQTILKIGEEGGEVYVKFTVKQIRED